MGLLEELAGAVLGGDRRQGGGADVSPDQMGALARSVLEMLERPQGRAGGLGGLDGLAERFGQAGLGGAVDSWIGTGANQPISPEDLRRALGSDALSELARRAGLGGAGASSGGGPDLTALLAQILPVLIDRLTPQGRAPQSGSLLEIGLDMLRNAAARSGQR